MKQTLVPSLALFAFLFAPWSSQAGDDPAAAHEQEVLIALHTDEFDLHETDISQLALGDAETIVTDSGRTIDLLRTEEGVEVYIDGELLDIGGLHGWALHDERHSVHKRWEVICDGDGECDDEAIVVPHTGPDADLLNHGGHGDRIIIIEKDVESD
jgi:hypothetical protein